MAYATNTPPRSILDSRDGDTPSVWHYASADSPDVVAGSGYITNATNLGMRVGDVVLVAETDNASSVTVMGVSSITAGAATLSSASELETGAGVGITGGTGTIAETSVRRVGGIIYTNILVDLTGLNSGGTAGDIIGTDGTGAAYLGQITAARNGTILGGRMTCLELPATGDTDIDLYSAVEATGVEDVAITTLDETQLVNAGTAALATVDYLTAMPAADEYLYLVGQGTSNATYTAGRFLIELWGV